MTAIMTGPPRSRPRLSFRLAFSLLLLLLLSAFPAAAPLVLRDGVDTYPLRGNSLDILEDRSGKLTINEVPVRLTIHDQGPGIPARLLDQVKTPFFTTKPPGQGTGLGLSIAHGIIADHGGALRLTSVEGISTTVTIDLPVAEGE